MREADGWICKRNLAPWVLTVDSIVRDLQRYNFLED